MSRLRRGWPSVLSVLLGCHASQGASAPAEQPYTGGGAEELPRLPKFPDPPVLGNGCERFPAPTLDGFGRLSLEIVNSLPRGGKQRPRVVVGHALVLALDCSEDVTQDVQVSFCLQRPDGTVLHEQGSYRNAEVQCVGCDPYPGAPPNVCANACQAERHVPELTPFDDATTQQDGAYLLSIEFEHATCAPVSVIFDAVGPEFSG